MGNAAPNSGVAIQQKTPTPTGACPVSPTPAAVTAAAMSSSPAADAAKCPISGQEAKNGQTCAYDPTKMSFWQTKAIAAALPPKSVEVKVQASEECPMRQKNPTASASAGEKSINSFVNVAADPKYKNPNQYNVS